MKNEKAEYFVHPNGLCESPHIGKDTKIWAFAHVLPQARLGSDCNICDNVFIENDVVIGDRVTIKCGVQVWDGIEIMDDVFIGPNATFTNDRFPRSKQYPDEFLRTVVKTKATIGANATILPGLTIGENAMIGAGAVVTRSVPPFAIVVGNPAKIIGYADAVPSSNDSSKVSTSSKPAVTGTNVSGVTLHTFKAVPDLRGSLSVGEFEREIPFTPKRYFLVYDVPTADTRGEHAHHQCHQFLIAVRGSIRVVVDDGVTREEITLDRPNMGLYLPPKTWGIQYKYSADAMLLVFASDYYDADDYIRDYGEFVDLIKSQKQA
ncbi:UDP-3-O-(3-hydroxymyristoyl)glucosamine N-acyltransferase [Pseudomonas fluorescens]|uniref:UDP-3-O-(3-hydroxymyristoyl)glucosamine N-acyltransferase n=1 Tax=Pseudomonas fluorescens TaxID=294 RepID=A0A5E7CJ03_PSEFL|nr:WxcM-like domain-containing protein [Pseudomonas fluorescens]VVO02208.1 UDP-3-O-(3-hydroxymyristoyl)glucosamine N-acyltransferase [Pseudomonas fluorescens]